MNFTVTSILISIRIGTFRIQSNSAISTVLVIFCVKTSARRRN
jgi:hypothetical protein